MMNYTLAYTAGEIAAIITAGVVLMGLSVTLTIVFAKLKNDIDTDMSNRAWHQN